MTEFSRETIGRCFIDENGVIWEQVAWTDYPTGSFRRVVEPDRDLHVVAGSNLGNGLRILSEREEADFRASLTTRVPVYAAGEVIAHVEVPQAFADLLAEKNARIEYDTTPILPDLAAGRSLTIDEATERIR